MSSTYDGKVLERISVDVSEENVFTPPLVKEGDSGSRGYIVTITNHGEPISIPNTNTTVWFNCRNKTDTTKRGSSEGVINDDGTVTVEVPTVVMDVAGYIECDISINTTNGIDVHILKTTLFVLNCEESANKNGTTSEAEDSILVQIAAGTIAVPGSYVPKTRTVAGLDLQNNITTVQLQTALNFGTKMSLPTSTYSVPALGDRPNTSGSDFARLEVGQIFPCLIDNVVTYWIKTDSTTAIPFISEHQDVSGKADLLPEVSSLTDLSQIKDGQLFVYSNELLRKIGTQNTYQFISAITRISGGTGIETATPQYIGERCLLNNELYVGISTQQGGFSKVVLSSDISSKENTSNKVTSISSSSTNTQYPSARAVKNYVDTVIGGIENGSY